MLAGMVQSRKGKEAINYEDIMVPHPEGEEEDTMPPSGNDGLDPTINLSYLTMEQFHLALPLFDDMLYDRKT